MSEQQAQRFLQQASYALQQRELQQALSFVEQAVALSPNNADAHLVRGIVLSQLGHGAEATAALNRSIQLAPHDAKGYYNMAVHFLGLGFAREAEEMANEALRRDLRHAAAAELINRIRSGTAASPQVPLPLAEGSGLAPLAGAESQSVAPPPFESSAMAPLRTRHGLRFIEAMGAAWSVLGLAIGALGLFTCVRIWQTFFPLAQRAAGNSREVERQINQMMLNDPGLNRLVLVGVLVVPLAALLWLVLDLADRNGPWWWLAIYIGVGVLGFCVLSPGLPWLFVPLYLLFRKK